jgi:hypothetical protein
MSLIAMGSGLIGVTLHLGHAPDQQMMALWLGCMSIAAGFEFILRK